MRRPLFWRLMVERAGGMATVTALSMPVLLGAAGLASDTIQWTWMKRSMQRQADSAALAGAFALAQRADVAATVTSDLTRNRNFNQTVSPVIETPPSKGGFAGNARAVRVALATSIRLPFVGIVMRSGVSIPAEATAMVVSQGDYCVLALETGNTAGINIKGNTTLNLNCGIMTNSPGTPAITATGSSIIRATPVAAVGSVPPSSNYAAGTQLIPYSVPQFDPFAAIPNPVLSGQTTKAVVKPNGSTRLSPGTYDGISIQGIAQFDPGIYYIDGGDVSFGSQAFVTGTDVVFVMTSRTAASNSGSVGRLTINAGADMRLTGAKTGTYAGILFYQDRRATANSVNKVNGNSNSSFQGAFYFPNQELQFNGTSGMRTDCMQLVARRLDFSGNSVINNICPPNEGAKSFAGTRIKLVE